MTLSRTGGRILVDNLVAQGCDRIFTVPGESFLAVLDALHDTPAVDLVVCRQEGGVAYMADADARMTGRPALPSSRGARRDQCRGRRARGAAGFDAHAAVHRRRSAGRPRSRGISGSRLRRDVRAARQMGGADRRCRPHPEYVARAWSIAVSGRPGPVVIALPEDMLTDVVEAVDRPRGPVSLRPPIRWRWRR
jgi:acetolactate synthase-1/2/3 large subunit